MEKLTDTLGTPVVAAGESFLHPEIITNKNRGNKKTRLSIVIEAMLALTTLYKIKLFLVFTKEVSSAN